MNIHSAGADIYGVIKPEPYITYGSTETLSYEFHTAIATYTIDASPGIVKSSSLTEENKKLEIVVVPPDEPFSIKLSVISTTGVEGNYDHEFLPFYYIVTPDGASDSKLVVVKPLGWDESPGSDWNDQAGYYWKWVQTLPITAYGKEIHEE